MIVSKSDSRRNAASADGETGRPISLDPALPKANAPTQSEGPDLMDPTVYNIPCDDTRIPLSTSLPESWASNLIALYSGPHLQERAYIHDAVLRNTGAARLIQQADKAASAAAAALDPDPNANSPTPNLHLAHPDVLDHVVTRTVKSSHTPTPPPAPTHLYAFAHRHALAIDSIALREPRPKPAFPPPRPTRPRPSSPPPGRPNTPTGRAVSACAPPPAPRAGRG